MFGNKRYKLNLHTHTLRSDGWVEPEEAARIYKEAGYDAISLNDHWVVEPGSVMSGLPIYSGCEYNFGIDPTEDGYVYHILSIMHDRDPMVELTDSPQICVDKIIAAGGIPVLAHPAWSLNDPAVFLELEGIEFTEIHNTISGKHNYCRPYSGGFIDLVACRGKLMKLFASDDTHHYDGDHTVASVMVKADSLDPADVKKALKAGDFYATTGPELHVSLGESTIEIDCSPCVTVDTFSNAVAARQHHIVGENMTHVSVPINKIDKFVRVEATDAEGRTAYSNFIKIR